jgi:hypothetical protein
LARQKFSSVSIVYLVSHAFVSATVKFNGKARFRAIEVDGIMVNGMLAPEFVICELPISQTAPENSLAVGCVFAEIASAVHKTDLSISEALPARSEIARVTTPWPLTSILSP